MRILLKHAFVIWSIKIIQCEAGHIKHGRLEEFIFETIRELGQYDSVDTVPAELIKFIISNDPHSHISRNFSSWCPYLWLVY